MSNTPNMGLPMPDPEANVDDEFYRLQTAMLLLDVILTTFAESIAGKSPQGHTHPIAGVNGLAAALASKMNADKKFSLVDLVDVLGASDAAAGYLLQKTVNGFGFTSVAAALGNHRHTTADIDGLVTLIQQYISALVDSSPATLDTLKELAAALGNDPNFATTMTTALGKKVNDTGDTMSGRLTILDSVNYGLHVQAVNTLYQGVQAMFQVGPASGGTINGLGPKANFHKAGLVQWNIGICDGADTRFGFFPGGSFNNAGTLRVAFSVNGQIILDNGSGDACTIQPNGDIVFGGQMAAINGATLHTALSNKVSVNYAATEGELNLPLGTTIGMQGNYNGIARNALVTPYLLGNYGYSNTATGTALIGTWRLVSMLSSGLAIARRVG